MEVPVGQGIVPVLPRTIRKFGSRIKTVLRINALCDIVRFEQHDFVLESLVLALRVQTGLPESLRIYVGPMHES